MNKGLLSLLALTTLTLASCSNAEELTPEVASTLQAQGTHTPEALDFDSSLFPAADKSTVLNPRSPNPGFNKLVATVDPFKVGLDRKEIDANDEQLKEIKTFTDELLKEAKDDADKVLKVIQWVNSNLKYDNTDNDSYSVFKNKTAVCQGYSNLMRAMLYTQGIPSIAVNGMLAGLGGHAWLYAYANKEWLVADPTNQQQVWKMAHIAKYTQLVSLSTNIDIFEDDNFVYNYNEGRLNVKKVKKSADVLVVPFSVQGFRVGSFSPFEAIPDNVKHIYLGSNIESIGESLRGLQAYRAQDEAIFVDPKNKEFGSEYGVLYRKDNKGALTELLYLPSQMRSLKLRPMEKIGTNTIYNHPSIEEIILLPGTKALEAFAIEECPNLKRLYLPKDCQMDPQALYHCSDNVEIFRGNFTGIARVKL